MVHILPLINTIGFAQEFDKKNWLNLEKHNGLLIERVITGHDIYERRRWWYDNGQIWGDINHKNGQLYGKHRRWHSNGQIEADVNYRDGKRHGRCRTWDKNGNLTSVYKIER